MKVLVALDGSAAAFRALSFALRRAPKGQDEVVAVSILDSRHVLLEARTGRRESEATASLTQQITALLEQAATVAAAQGVKIRTEMRASSDPASDIVRFCREAKCDEILLGHRTKDGLEKAVLGSTALRVIELADVPVPVVR